MRGATVFFRSLFIKAEFLLTRLLRGATNRSFEDRLKRTGFLLTRLLRGATRPPKKCPRLWFISTHAPLARRDKFIKSVTKPPKNFYSRASCEARPGFIPVCNSLLDFYSRASCEARPGFIPVCNSLLDFYSRASCEARPPLFTRSYPAAAISTHAPLARRDLTRPPLHFWK